MSSGHSKFAQQQQQRPFASSFSSSLTRPVFERLRRRYDHLDANLMARKSNQYRLPKTCALVGVCYCSCCRYFNWTSTLYHQFQRQSKSDATSHQQWFDLICSTLANCSRLSYHTTLASVSQTTATTTTTLLSSPKPLLPF